MPKLLGGKDKDVAIAYYFILAVGSAPSLVHLLTLMMIFCNEYFTDEDFTNEIPSLFEMNKRLENYLNQIKGKPLNKLAFDLRNRDQSYPSVFFVIAP